MIVDFIQKSKELFSADFEIKNNDGLEFLGQLHYENEKGISKLSGEWSGKLFDREISLSFEEKSVIINEINNCCRPCLIIIDGIKKGIIYQYTEKSGLFSNYSYYKMEYKENLYEMYPIGFGKEGAKNPVYLGKKQIAQIEKDFEVINDLHNFRVFSVDDVSALISILFSCYMYTISFYKHGIKVSISKEKNYSKTKNKALLEKYNPNFKSNNFVY